MRTNRPESLRCANGDTARDALKLLKEFRKTLRLGKEHRQLTLPELRAEHTGEPERLAYCKEQWGVLCSLKCGFEHRLTPFI